MIKILCMLAFICLGAFFGVQKERGYIKRVSELNACELMMIRIKTYIAAERTRTDILIKNLCKADSLSELTFLKTAAERLKDEIDFPKIWTESVEQSKKELALKPSDYEPITALSELIGQMDSDGILAGIEPSLALLRQAEQEAQKSADTEGKLYKRLFFLSGIAAAVLIL